LQAARALREAIYRSCLAVIAGRPLAGGDVRTLNETAARPPLRPCLVGQELVQVADLPVEAALSTLAADALRLFGTGLRERIRVCPGCQMLFVDNSRPGRRRWCSSVSGCGNRAKVRNLRARRKKSSSRTNAR
jgi:predicted RNA-binding Zn ribbon-like protein